MSDANRILMTYSRKDLAGVSLGIIDEGKKTTLTDESFQQTTDSINSTSIRNDRQTRDVVRTSINAEGDLNFELIWSEQDDFMENGLFSVPWTGLKETFTATDISFAATDTITSLTGTAFDNFAVGDLITVTGASNAENNGNMRILTQSSTVLTVEGRTLVTEAAGASVTVEDTFNLPVPDVSASDITAVDAGNLIQSATTLAFTDFEVGAWVFISGFSNAANNGYARIAAIQDDAGVEDELVLEEIDLVDEAAGPAVVIKVSSFVTNGTTRVAYDWEKEFEDLPNAFAKYNDTFLNTFALDISAESILTGAAGFMGGDVESTSSTRFTFGVIEPGIDPVINAVDDVPLIIEGGGVAGFEAISAAFALTNNLRKQPIIGQLKPKDYGVGKFEVTGTLTAYFEDQAVFDKYLAFTNSSLFIIIEDINDMRYLIEIPRLNYTSGARVAGGENTDIIADLAWTAFIHETLGFTMRIHRFAT